MTKAAAIKGRIKLIICLKSGFVIDEAWPIIAIIKSGPGSSDEGTEVLGRVIEGR